MTLYCEGFRKKVKDSFVHVMDKTEVLIRPDSEKLIVGTMISYRGRYLKGATKSIDESFDFFYPNTNKNSLWYFLKETYSIPKKLQKKQEKEDFLFQKKIGMVNLIQTAFCEKDSSDDSDIVIETLKEDIVTSIAASKIREIYFTSINARNLFNLYLKHHNSISESVKMGILINDREYKYHTLPNPTNRGKKGQTKTWKLSQYKEMFLG